jgi:hypothetical protein
MYFPTCSFSFPPPFAAAVSQPFATETHNTYVIVGNSALFKCEIPSHVADFVSVESWADGDGKEYFLNRDYGKRRRRCC